MATILIVDDHGPSRSFVSWCLQALGYQTLEAQDGVEALAVARVDRPDLVLSDALMPRMDGFSLCRAWMADPQLATVPFLFYSGSYPSEADRAFGLSIGASGYLTKPMSPEDLAAAIDRTLQDHTRHASGRSLNGVDFDATHSHLVTRKLEAKIVELNAVSEAYKNQREEYERLFRSNPQPMWICDPDTLRCLAVNDAAVSVYGYSRDEWLTMRTPELSGAVAPESSDDRLETDRAVPLHGNEVATHTKKDGSKILVEISAHALDFGGRPARVVMALDVTERIRAHEREQVHLQRIEEAMCGTITVVTRMVEVRDPYTAGHERRTAELCRAIGLELNLGSDQIDGLVMAAMVHDIGKIAIPSDILTKPGKLSQIERMYIEQHAEAGYDLLKGVPFPWPIAEIVYQHHERMDGSGYPRGLEGAAILLQARILAVADTLEAMASHRPYRPAFSIEAALKEIETKAGITYDEPVAKACLRLFRNKGYALPRE